MPHVILIEDDALVRKLLEKRLCAAGWTVTPLRDGRSLLDMLVHHRPDLIVADLGLPHGDGLTLVENIRAKGITIPVMVVTGYDLPHLHATVRSTGANDLVQKPYDVEQLIGRMAALIAA